MSQHDESKQFANQLIELQSQLTFQEDIVQALNDVVTRQQQQIDRLQEQSERFKLQLEMAITAFEGSEVIDQPPPHY